jgi:HSP20 family molecular chaperone IbpA
MVRFTEPVDLDKVVASYRDGSLTIQVPRETVAPEPVRQIPVETQTALAATAG